MKNGGKKIRILLADDHLVVRMGLSAILSFEKDMTVVAEAADGLDAVRLAAETKPDVVVMDLMMPQLDGAEATARILAADPTVGVVVLTSYGGSIHVKRALDAGAKSALLKSTARTVLVDAIRRTAAGESVVCPEISNTLKSDADGGNLSDRKLEILRYVAKGLSNREIAEILKISPNGIKNHLKIVFARIGVATRSEAVAFAVAHNMVDP